MNQHLSRRSFLKTSAATGAVLVVVSHSPALLAQDAPLAGPQGTVPALLSLGKDGRASLLVPVPDMGQGTMTLAAQLIADELDIDLGKVSVEIMPWVGGYEDGKARMGGLIQGVGGSLTTGELWMPLRRTAAYVRGLLIAAAARRWNTDAAGLSTKAGDVVRLGDRLAYTDLIDDIRGAQAPTDWAGVAVKDRTAQTVIGKNQRNKSAPDIVTGKPIFGIDQDVPGMLHAVIRRCPHLKGRRVKFDAAAAEKMPGVVSVHPIDARSKRSGDRLIAAGVAVVAQSYWQAKKAAETLEIEWDGNAGMDADSELIRRRAMTALDIADMKKVVEDGNIETAFAGAAKTVEATYHHPTWAHTCLEPHNCIADVRADSAEIWVGHQFMDEALNAASTATGLPADRITGHFYRMGTGFGRKFEQDYVTEACLVSKAVGKPVKLTWSREDEMEQDFYNSTGAYRYRGALDADGRLTAIHARGASDSWFAESCVQELPYGLVDNYKGESMQMNTAISNGAWRGPGSNTRAWVTLSFLDEMAIAAGRDPMDFLIEIFSRKPRIKMENWPFVDLDLSRHVAVLKKVEEASAYRMPVAKGRGRGVAVFQTHHSLCAHVVEVEMKGEHDFSVIKVTSAIDCGLPVNPLGIRAQVESGIHDGLCAAKYGKMIFKSGVPVTNNFDSYRKLRIDEAPREIDIHIMDHGDTAPRGTGETALPPFIPALTNAIFAASGKRIHTLPISENL